MNETPYKTYFIAKWSIALFIFIIILAIFILKVSLNSGATRWIIQSLISIPFFLILLLLCIDWRIDITKDYVKAYIRHIPFLKRTYNFSDIESIFSQNHIVAHLYYIRGCRFFSQKKFTLLITEGAPAKHKDLIREIIFRSNPKAIVDNKTLKRVNLTEKDIGKNYISQAKHGVQPNAELW